MNLLALDLGTHTGWAFRPHGLGTFESGVQVFDLKRGESPGMRYLRFGRWLREFLLPPSPDLSVATLSRSDALVVYERAHHRGGAATEVHIGLATRVQEFCAERGYEHAAVASTTLKKWTTGRGNADKDQMVETARLRWLAGRNGISDDEADAVALLHYAIAELL